MSTEQNTSTVRVRQMRPDELLRRWAEIEPIARRVIGRFDPRQSLEATLALLVTGRQQLHVIECGDEPGKADVNNEVLAIVITEIVQYANGFRELLIPDLAGKNIQSFVAPLASYLRSFMRQEECDVGTAMVRRGLVKPYEQVGLELSPLIPMILRRGD